MSICKGCTTRDSEIVFLRSMLVKLTDKPVIEPSRSYQMFPDGSVEYQDDTMQPEEEELEDA